MVLHIGIGRPTKISKYTMGNMHSWMALSQTHSKTHGFEVMWQKHMENSEFLTYTGRWRQPTRGSGRHRGDEGVRAASAPTKGAGRLTPRCFLKLYARFWFLADAEAEAEGLAEAHMFLKV